MNVTSKGLQVIRENDAYTFKYINKEDGLLFKECRKYAEYIFFKKNTSYFFFLNILSKIVFIPRNKKIIAAIQSINARIRRGTYSGLSWLSNAKCNNVGPANIKPKQVYKLLFGKVLNQIDIRLTKYIIEVHTSLVNIKYLVIIM